MDDLWGNIEGVKIVISAVAVAVAIFALYFAAHNLKQSTVARRATTLNNMFSHISGEGLSEIRAKLVCGPDLKDEELRRIINVYDRCALIASDDRILQARLLNFQSDAIHAIMTKHAKFIYDRRNPHFPDYARHLEELWNWAASNQALKKPWNKKWPEAKCADCRAASENKVNLAEAAV